MNTSKFIAIATGFLTLSLALFSFILSFNALKDLASDNGVSIPWLLPFLVEFGVITFSLAAMYRSVNGENAKWQWALVIGSSLVAGIFNVAHAEVELLARVIAAMPSIFLLASFETFLSQVKYQFKRQGVVNNLDKLTASFVHKETTLDKQLERMRTSLRDRFNSERTKLTDTLSDLDKQTQEAMSNLDKVNGQMSRAETKLKDIKVDISRERSASISEMNAAKQGKIDQRRKQVLDMLQQSRTPDDIATTLGVSPKTIKRDILELNGQNGAGAK